MNTTSSNTPKRNPRITHRHILMAACALIAAGYLLMAGPATTQQAFCPDIFSTCRIVIAPYSASAAICSSSSESCGRRKMLKISNETKIFTI